MSEEEKEAIESIKYVSKFYRHEFEEISISTIKAVVNYIDKLQKENKELKEDLERDIYARDCLAQHSISKDKIRNKIKELEQENKYKSFYRKQGKFNTDNAEMEMYNTWAIFKLEELLEEN